MLCMDVASSPICANNAVGGLIILAFFVVNIVLSFRGPVRQTWMLYCTAV